MMFMSNYNGRTRLSQQPDHRRLKAEEKDDSRTSEENRIYGIQWEGTNNQYKSKNNNLTRE